MTSTTTVARTLYSIADVQAATGLGRSKLYELITKGELPSVKVGKRRLIPADAFDGWLRALRSTTATTR